MIVNIINFIRAVEPRDPGLDLVQPVREQLRLVREYDFPATWLLQYDSLCDTRFTDLLRNLNDRQEMGLWFEVVQPLVEAAGLPWRGRYPWDWHSHVDYAIGYAPAERERLADLLVAQFRAVFDRDPHSVGSWVLDAHTLAYLADRYGIVAACNCKDQWGTDGYTLWGGYFNQAYYPSRRNVYMPAQHAEAQIPTPVFRMLGSDPIYQYDDALGENGQGVVTLEPVYPHGGGAPGWVRWFFDTMIAGPNLSFGYAQVGQENSFGWPAMADGLTDQFAVLAERVAAGQVRVQTLAESGAWFRARYPVTPASAVTALTDWRGEGRASAWYCSRFYRLNLLREGNGLCIRDLHCFDERYAERYLHDTCPGNDCTYDTLPVVEGFLWSDATTRADLRPVALETDGSHTPLAGGTLTVAAESEDVLRITWLLDSACAMVVRCAPTSLTISADHPAWAWHLTWGATLEPPITAIAPDSLSFRHEDFAYRVACRRGRLRPVPDGLLLLPEAGVLELDLGR